MTGRPWTLVTKPAADRALQALWLDGRDRAALTEASAEMDAALTADPTAAGELRMPQATAEAVGAEVRLAFFGPLAVRFFLERAERRVTILDIRRARPGPTRR